MASKLKTGPKTQKATQSMAFLSIRTTRCTISSALLAFLSCLPPSYFLLPKWAASSSNTTTSSQPTRSLRRHILRQFGISRRFFPCCVLSPTNSLGFSHFVLFCHLLDYYSRSHLLSSV